MSNAKVRLVREIDGTQREVFVGPQAVQLYIADGWVQQDAPPPTPRPRRRPRPAPSPAPSGSDNAPTSEED